MSKKILTIALAFSMACLVSFEVSSASCDAGGPGSTSCSSSTTVEGTIAGSGGSTTHEASVTCGEGYYACCNSSARKSSASCVAN